MKRKKKSRFFPLLYAPTRWLVDSLEDHNAHRQDDGLDDRYKVLRCMWQPRSKNATALACEARV